LTWIWVATSCTLFALLCLSTYYNYKFGVIILNVQDGIEDSLDILDERYLSMSKILEKPVFFDSVEVRQVVRDIKDTRDSVLKIANILGSIDKSSIENDADRIEGG
jgi:hypothetical protein